MKNLLKAVALFLGLAFTFPAIAYETVKCTAHFGNTCTTASIKSNSSSHALIVTIFPYCKTSYVVRDTSTNVVVASGTKSSSEWPQSFAIKGLYGSYKLKLDNTNTCIKYTGALGYLDNKY